LTKSLSFPSFFWYFRLVFVNLNHTGRNHSVIALWASAPINSDAVLSAFNFIQRN